MDSSNELFQHSRKALEWAQKQFGTRVHTLFYFLHDVTNPQMTIKITIFSHRPHVSLARFSFCWWHHNRLLMTSQWPHNCDTIMWIVISNSLDINFIHGDIHSRLCKKDRLLYGLKPRLHYTRRDTTWRDATRSHDWVPMKSTGPFTLCATRRHATWSPNLAPVPK